MDKVLQRAEETANYEVFTQSVEKILVFGSYLDRSRSDYGDLDLVVLRQDKSSFLGSTPKIYRPQELRDLYGRNAEDTQIAVDQINGRIMRWYELYESGILKSRPPKPQMYLEMHWDEFTVQQHIKCRNHRISLHTLAEIQALNINQVALVYDANQGGRLARPEPLNPAQLEQD